MKCNTKKTCEFVGSDYGGFPCCLSLLNEKSVVLENDQYDDYFTEKITDCFAQMSGNPEELIYV